MSMQLKDVAHYYIGQSCVNDFFPEGHGMRYPSWVLTVYDKSSRKPYKLENEVDYTWTADIKPILRRLSDMEEEEAKGFLSIVQGEDARYKSHNETAVFYSKPGVLAGDSWFIYNSPEAFHYLLERGFDLWNLIDNKQAVDVKTIKQ